MRRAPCVMYAWCDMYMNSPSHHTMYLLSTFRKNVCNQPQTIPPVARC